MNFCASSRSITLASWQLYNFSPVFIFKLFCVCSVFVNLLTYSCLVRVQQLITFSRTISIKHFNLFMSHYCLECIQVKYFTLPVGDLNSPTYSKGPINLFLRDPQELHETVYTKSYRVDTSPKYTEYIFQYESNSIRFNAGWKTPLD